MNEIAKIQGVELKSDEKQEQPIKLSPDQQSALDEISAWVGKGGKRKSLGGYAGTGKTTLIKAIRRKHKARVCAFTGKAAHVLTTKGVSASTIHRLIYKPAFECEKCQMRQDFCSCRKPSIVTVWIREPNLNTRLVIVDEASMVNRDLMTDLESFANVQVLYVGDHGQLEPIGDDPGLMAAPDIRLEQIHRQAAGSPIIQFAHHVREGNAPKTFGDDASVFTGAPGDLTKYDAILCGYNATRVNLNARKREQLGYSGPLPEVGERVICLRNDKEHGVFNGMQATVTKLDAEKERISIEDDAGQEIINMHFWPKQFGAEKTDRDAPRNRVLFDFGYAMTVHKSQGSEWDRVLVLEQISKHWSGTRWRYTAATRAAKSLTYCMQRRRR